MIPSKNADMCFWPFVCLVLVPFVVTTSVAFWNEKLGIRYHPVMIRSPFSLAEDSQLNSPKRDGSPQGARDE